MKRLVRNNCTGCHTPSYVLQHRFDEAGWNAIIELMKNANVYGTFVGNDRKPVGHSRLPSEGIGGLSRARARAGRKRHEVQARSASRRRDGAGDVQGIRRPARSGRRPPEQFRAERRQRLVARDAVRPHPGLGRARRLARSRRPALVHLQHPEPAHDHRQDRSQDRRGQAVHGAGPQRARGADPRHDPRRQGHHLVQRQQRPRRPGPPRSQDRAYRRLPAAAGNVADRRSDHRRSRRQRQDLVVGSGWSVALRSRDRDVHRVQVHHLQDRRTAPA